MNPKIRIENWNGYEIRFVWIEDKQEWRAVLADVCAALEIKNVSQLARSLNQGICITYTLNDANGRAQTYIIVAEPGVYKAVFRSRKPEAEEFQEWVFNYLKALRQSTGLEGFQIFRMLDKEHQKEMMAKLKSDMKEPDKGTFIKANTITNKAVANMYGLLKTVNKNEMTPEQLQTREEILADTVEVMTLKDKYDLNMSVSKTIYDKYKKFTA